MFHDFQSFSYDEDLQKFEDFFREITDLNLVHLSEICETLTEGIKSGDLSEREKISCGLLLCLSIGSFIKLIHRYLLQCSDESPPSPEFLAQVRKFFSALTYPKELLPVIDAYADGFRISFVQYAETYPDFKTTVQDFLLSASVDDVREISERFISEIQDGGQFLIDFDCPVESAVFGLLLSAYIGLTAFVMTKDEMYLHKVMKFHWTLCGRDQVFQDIFLSKGFMQDEYDWNRLKFLADIYHKVSNMRSPPFQDRLICFN